MKGKNPEHAVFSPDGKWLYVSAEEADSVDIIDVARGEVVKSITVGERPRGIGFLPDGSRAYVGAEQADIGRGDRRRVAERSSQKSRPASARTASPCIPTASASTCRRAATAPCR